MASIPFIVKKKKKSFCCLFLPHWLSSSPRTWHLSSLLLGIFFPRFACGSLFLITQVSLNGTASHQLTHLISPLDLWWSYPLSLCIPFNNLIFFLRLIIVELNKYWFFKLKCLLSSSPIQNTTFSKTGILSILFFLAVFPVPRTCLLHKRHAVKIYMLTTVNL